MNNNIYIGSVKRLLIYIVDVIFVGLVLSLTFGESESAGILTIEFILFFAYFILMVSYFGYTLGQRLFKVRTVDSKSGNTPSIKQLVLREVSSLTAWSGIGFLIANFTHSYSTGFYWDKWTGIKVIPINIGLEEFNNTIKKDQQALLG
jgi:uncharacterized RDD family membrane protein YckC